MVNLDNVKGINYKASSFSFKDKELVLRFYTNKECEKFIEEHSDLIKKRLSPGTVTITIGQDEKWQVVQDYLSNGVKTSLDPSNELAARCFTGAINYASFVFSNNLMYGGSYRVNEVDKRQILEHLGEIARILVKYESKGN